MARPRKKIDGELVRKLAAIHCTIREIAAVCDCSHETIERRFALEVEKGREQGKTKLRQGLWELAGQRNLGALIWLSKQHLGMSEKSEVKQETNVPASITFQVKWGDEQNDNAAAGQENPAATKDRKE